MHILKVVPYNPNWPALFEEEAAKIKEALGKNCIHIHHIGSTSVPGLDAKPIIDMIPVVRDILKVNSSALEALGYIPQGEYGMAFRRLFHKGKTERTHHMHIWEEGNPEIDKHLLFRDYLIKNPIEAKRYADLKYQLIEETKARPNLTPQQINIHYMCNKDPFIREMRQKSGYEGLSIVQALMDDEWKSYHRIRGADENLGKIEIENHYHFVLIKCSDVIGMFHIELLDNGRAILHHLAIDMAYQNQGHEEMLRRLAEKWANHQGREI